MTIIKSLNGELVPMTSEEETKFLAQQQEAQIAMSKRQEEELVKKEAKATAKASALAKLSALGLTEEEVQAIIK
jgi:hypothetical protein